MGHAMTLMANSIRAGAQPAERTVVPATSFPNIEDLQTKRVAHSAGKSK
jgi:hypothetical protein